MKSFNAEMKNAIPLLVSNDYNAAVQVSASLAKNAHDKISKARAQLFLAASLFRRNKDYDRARAIGYYNAIINDYSIPPDIRARTVSAAATFVAGANANFLKTYLSEPPLDRALGEVDKPHAPFRAAIKLYEYSDELFPNFVAEYGIAYYNSILLTNNELDEGVSQEEAAKFIQKYLKDADEKMAIVGVSEYLSSAMAREYLQRAIAMELSSRILGNISLSDRENAHQIALAKTATDNANNVLMRAAEMSARFFYASFLEANFGKTGSRAKDIAELLRPFAPAATDTVLYASTRSQFLSLWHAPNENLRKGRAIKLAQISPEFKTFLLSLGWKI